MLPFGQDAFFALFEQYNRAIWPAQIGAYVLALAALTLAFRPRAGSGRVVAAILALAWAWNGAVYHLAFFATINFWADIFGALFIFEALLLLWTGVVRGKLAFRFRGDLASWIGLALAVFAMAVYPLIGWLLGHGWPRAPMFGVAPCPLTIFSMGLLLLAERRLPLHLLAIPVLWSLIGGTAAWFLGVTEDLALPVAGLGGLALALWQGRRALVPAGPG
ncbi:MAG TPA: DUF6064 family protein [Alphaproteobacteria bacterium]|jgi:hypothetical protein